MSQEVGIVQDGLTGKEEPAKFAEWSTNDRKWDHVTNTYVLCRVYRYGVVILSTTSELGQRLLARNTFRYPLLIKSKTGKALPAWVCSLGYIYKRTPRMKINVRYLDSLKYCEHLEKVREEGYIKKSSQLSAVIGDTYVKKETA